MSHIYYIGKTYMRGKYKNLHLQHCTIGLKSYISQQVAETNGAEGLREWSLMQAYEYMDEKSDVRGAAALLGAAACRVLSQGGVGSLAPFCERGGAPAERHEDV